MCVCVCVCVYVCVYVPDNMYVRACVCRQQVDKEHKQAMLRAARARQRARTLSADTDSSASESECEGGSERVTEPLQTPVYTVERGWPLPDDITHRVMCCVSDPYTLARATCVSRYSVLSVHTHTHTRTHARKVTPDLRTYADIFAHPELHLFSTHVLWV